MADYETMKQILKRQSEKAEELLASGNLNNPEWIRNNIDIQTDDESIRQEVYGWLNDYTQTPEGAKNLAYALVNEYGGEHKLSIDFVKKNFLNQGLAGGTGSAIRRQICLGKDDWDKNKEWNRNQCLPHEMRHVGQVDSMPDLTQREYTLYNSLIVEADARLTEYSDGITEGRNPNHTGYLGLDENFQKAIKDLNAIDIKSWEDFEALKSSDRTRYDRILGLIKEQEFSEVLNHLGMEPMYQLQGHDLLSIHENSSGNLEGIRACVEQMCAYHGMRFDHVWPEVEAMATGKKEIPGWEGAFDEKGRVTSKFEQNLEELNTIVNRDVVASKIEGRRKTRFFADGTRECTDYYETGEWERKENRHPDGSVKISFFDKNGNRITEETVEKDYHCVVKYEYDEFGKMIRSETTNSNGFSETTKYEYDDNGKMIRNSSDMSNGHRRIIEFDNSGISRVVFYDQDGNSTVRKFLNGEKIGEERYNKDGSLIAMYDAKGKEIRSGKVVPQKDEIKTEEGTKKKSNSAKTKKHQRQIDNGKGIDEQFKSIANDGKGWQSVENEPKEETPERETANKTAEKPYYGHREGGIDDTIAKVDAQERVKMNVDVKTNE